MEKQSENVLNNFQKELGIHCASNQFTELSIKVLNEKYRDDISSIAGLTELSRAYGLNITAYTRDNLIHRISCGYIVNISVCFESYLNRISELMKKYGKYEWKNREKEESTLENVTNNLYREQKSCYEELLFNICDYYRLIRNSSVHEFSEKKNNDSEKVLRKIMKSEYLPQLTKEKIVAPNSFEKINFNDFLLYAAACNEFAIYLYNKLEYNYNELVSEVLKSNGKKWGKYTKKRMLEATFSLIQMKYGTCDDLKEIIADKVKDI